MDCRECIEKIPLYIERKLSDAEITAVEEHIDKCVECSKLLDSMLLESMKAAKPEKSTFPVDYSLNPAFKRNYITRSLVPILILLFLALIIKDIRKSSPGRSPEKPAQIIMEENEWNGYYSSFKSPATMVVKDTDSWYKLWGKLIQNGNFHKPAPLLDFNRQMAVAVFLGEKNKGGYAVRITGILNEKDNITVKYIELSPPEKALTSQEHTQPYSIKLTGKSDLPVIFLETEGQNLRK